MVMGVPVPAVDDATTAPFKVKVYGAPRLARYSISSCTVPVKPK
jgi:hypothetical protein